MRLANIPSSRLINTGSNLHKSGLAGMGDIWGDLMTATSNYFGSQSAASIAQSQATQATAAAQIAASQAAQQAAAQQAAGRNTTMMLLGGGALVLVGVVLLRRKGRH